MSSSSSALASATSSAAAATSSSATKTLSAGSNLKVVGIILAVVSGLLIGSSFVFKKKGLLRSQAGHVAGEGVAYLKSPLWWLGMSMMILGELCNFAAYAFVEALVVTPLGALSVVICAILSSIFLKETLSFFGWLGCALCILGSVIIALNGPTEASVGQIKEFQKLFLAPGFLSYAGVLIAAALTIIFYFGPRYGKKSMLWYIFVCSMIGGISVSVTTGLGAAIVQTALGDNQFKYWFMYFLMAFVIVTLLTEVYYLNMALALFNTAMVTPTYYVIFTFFSMVTTIVLFQGLKSSVSQIITLVMGFLVICLGITILQMSKVDPVTLSKLDRRSTILLEAARANTEILDEKGAIGVEDPGMDALRGSFGTVGSIIRARSARRLSQSSSMGMRTRPSTGISFRDRPPGAAAPYDSGDWTDRELTTSPPAANAQLAGIRRHQLYDAPVPRDLEAGSMKSPSLAESASGGQLVGKRQTIKFDNEEIVHQYHPPGTGDDTATHEHRSVLLSPGHGEYPPPQRQPTTGTSLSTISATDSQLGLDTPIVSPGGSVRQLQQQQIPVPPRFQMEHEVHSAPPTMGSRFVRPVPGRTDSRDVFSHSKLSNNETLLSFPSVTDSARSQNWDIVNGSDSSVDENGKKEKERGRSPKKHQKYPKGAGEDDREESVSLWQQGEDRDSSTESLVEVPPSGGIRLVQSGSSGARF